MDVYLLEFLLILWVLLQTGLVLTMELSCDTSQHWDFKKLIDSEHSWGQGLMGGISVQ